MKIIRYFILLINIVALILSKTKRTKSYKKALSKSKSIFLRRPFSYYQGIYRGLLKPRQNIVSRPPLFTRSPLLIPLANYDTCPLLNLSRKPMVGHSAGNCRLPCTINNCIQLYFECCIYS